MEDGVGVPMPMFPPLSIEKMLVEVAIVSKLDEVTAVEVPMEI